MKQPAKKSVWAGTALCLINLLWLMYNTYQYLSVPAWFESPEIFVMLVFIGLLVLLFSHIVVALSVILNINRQPGVFLPGIVLLIIGALSFTALFFHWGALTDVLKEYPAGLETGKELKAIWISHILHFSFITYALIFFFRIRKLPIPGKAASGLVGEQLFVSLNIIGIVCGITGLFIVAIDFYFRVNPQWYKWAIIPYSLFVFIPWLLVLSGWFLHAFRGKKSGWYDEKQKFDIYKSSAFTLVVSIPLMLLLFIFTYRNAGGIVSILWLPFYLFVILSVFSISSLYNFKSN